jgi:hypothetical protein
MLRWPINVVLASKYIGQSKKKCFKFSRDDTIQNVDYISKFKSELKKIDETENHAVPKHYL